MQLLPMKIEPSELKNTLSVAENYTPSPYPYGLCLSLNKEVIEKLHMDGELPEVGAFVTGGFIGKVTSVSRSADENNENMCVEIQITNLGIEEGEGDNDDDDKALTPSERVYGKNK